MIGARSRSAERPQWTTMPPALFAASLSITGIRERLHLQERSFVPMSVLETIISKLLGSEARQSRLTHYDQRIERVVQATSEVTGVPVMELLSKRRLNADERHCAMYLSVKLLGCSYPEVGRAFGRDHSSVYYAVKKLEKRGRGRSKTTRILKEIERCLAA